MSINTSKTKNPLAGRGTVLNLPNRFSLLLHVEEGNMSQEIWESEDDLISSKTKFIEVKAVSMLNAVTSPDLPMDYSLNPYQGCEHGCIYCYARPTHNYWGYNAAEEFENTILIKTNAVEVLKKELLKPNYKVSPIFLSGNTDCYQPAERKYKITKSILQLMLDWKHPVSVLTKNALILRDIDLLEELNKHRLCSVAISITTLDETLRRFLEPRASSVSNRLKTIETFCNKGIPVHVMLAPIIPGVNDHEIMEMLKTVAKLGVSSASYQMVRLNGEVETIFLDWLEKYMPDRKQKIIENIKSCRNGKLSETKFKLRMKGEGNYSEIIKQQFQLATKKYLSSKKIELNKDLFITTKPGQLSLF